MVLYGPECWTLMKQQIKVIERVEMRFLRAVVEYRTTNEGIKTSGNSRYQHNDKSFFKGNG
jgi:hypothetical protein